MNRGKGDSALIMDHEHEHDAKDVVVAQDGKGADDKRGSVSAFGAKNETVEKKMKHITAQRNRASQRKAPRNTQNVRTSQPPMSRQNARGPGAPQVSVKSKSHFNVFVERLVLVTRDRADHFVSHKSAINHANETSSHVPPQSCLIHSDWNWPRCSIGENVGRLIDKSSENFSGYLSKRCYGRSSVISPPSVP